MIDMIESAQIPTIFLLLGDRNQSFVSALHLRYPTTLPTDEVDDPQIAHHLRGLIFGFTRVIGGSILDDITLSLTTFPIRQRISSANGVLARSWRVTGNSCAVAGACYPSQTSTIVAASFHFGSPHYGMNALADDFCANRNAKQKFRTTFVQSVPSILGLSTQTPGCLKTERSTKTVRVSNARKIRRRHLGHERATDKVLCPSG